MDLWTRIGSLELEGELVAIERGVELKRNMLLFHSNREGNDLAVSSCISGLNTASLFDAFHSDEFYCQSLE
jgi:hypothetical protein